MTPAAESPPVPPVPPRRWVLPVVAITALGLLFLRRVDAFLLPQFWAEDFVFLLQANAQGAATLFQPFAGYLCLITRLIAWVTTYLDPLLQPGFFLLGWLAVFYAVVCSCLSSRHDLPLKPGLAIAVALVPHTGEVFYTPTNINWVAALLLVLIAVKRDATRWPEWLSDVGGLVLAGLSGPSSIFATPIFLHRAFVRRSRASLLCALLVTGLAGTQVWFVLNTPSHQEFVGPFQGIEALIATPAMRGPYNVFFGSYFPGGQGRPFAIAAAAALVAFLGYAVWRCRSQRQAAAYMAAFALLMLAATARWKRFDLWVFGDLWNGDRYFFVPKVVLLWLTLTVAATAPARWIRGIALCLLLCSAATNAKLLRFKPMEDFHWYEKVADIRAGQAVEVTIPPGAKYTYQRPPR